ncbi:MAG: amino acid adenylation domain-containing protein, partial [Saprospiraceae bacterium]|nr:amino acid adenylation domain-containing protein [Saprospiraceae bacterium]
MNRDPSHKAASNLEKWLKLNKKTQGQSAIPSMPPGESPLLSHGQERLWFLDRFNPGSVLYHYAHCYDIKGDFHCLVFKEALEILTKRHEILRTNFLEQDGAPILFVHEHRSIPLFEVDLFKLPGEIKARTLVEGTRDFILTPFDLATDVLIKFTLFKLDIKRYQLILVIHHIIGDRWSLNILHNEISTIYQALLAGREPTLQPLAIQYKDYAHWQRKKETDPNSLKFWSEKLDKDQMLPTLPYDQKKAVYTISGATHVLEWPSNISNELKEFAQAQGVTLYVLLLSIFHVLLYRYSRTDHILIGTPFSNRDKPILDHLIGFFNETLVIGAEITPQMSFLQMLRQVNQSVREAMMHRDVPFELLVNTLKPNRYAGENPLFNTMFLFNVEDQTSILDPELEIEHHAIDLEIAKFDLTLFISEKKDQLQLTWEYSQGLFSKERIKDISTHYQILTRAILADPTTAVKDLDLISEAEKDLILNKWNSSVNVQSPYTTILDLFAKHTEKNPDQVAVIYEGQRLTYEELDIWSNQLALQLLKSQVQSGDFVGVYTPRSLEMIVGILAVMKAGAAYLPLDPDYPADRIQYMMADASVNHVLYHPATVPDWANPAHRFLKISATKDDPAHPLEVQCKAQDIAYLIYTSGSSGKPKGVVVTHQNLMSSIWARHTFYDEKVRCFLLLSSFSFDSSVVGIFSSISSGGTLLIPPSRIEQDTEKLGRLISRFQVSHTLLLPTLYSVLLEYVNPQELSSLSNVILAGEACSSAVVKRHFEVLPGVNLYNEYGPTEATVWCIAHKILPDEAQDRVPIGKPIQNTQAYILDSHLRLVPPGIKGELYIAGVGVTPGYLNRPALTRERFLVNPFDDKSNTTLYKTGDLAAYRGDGVIDFYGRVDNQVKIRGYRVELDEIKATVLSYPDVTDAIIQVQEAQGPTRQGNQQIAAHVIGKESTVDKLVIFLRERLPSYMVPRLIISHDTFPRLPNGKIDYSALADFIV